MSNNTNVPVIDVALLRKTLEHIENHENEWRQMMWRTPSPESSCGTTMCFGGWAAHLMDCEWASKHGDMVVANEADHEWAEEQDMLTDEYGDPIIRREGGREVIHVAYRARRLLGLTRGQANNLFSGGNNLDDLREAVDQLTEEAYL